MKNKQVIGIPRALLYYKYHIQWETFFKSLGCEVIVSPETNMQILKDGVNLAVDESCLALKLFFGHVEAIKDKVDYVLVPRIVSMHKDEQHCTKFMGLYDNTNNSIKDAKLIEYNIDLETNQTEFLGYFQMGQKIEKNPLKIIRAYMLAKKAQKTYHDKQVTDQLKLLEKKQNKLKILVVSHPYVIFDDFIGQPIIQFMTKQPVELFFSDRVNSEEARLLSKKVSETIYWTYNKEFLGAIEQFKNKVDGIIYVAAFPCGPDALSIELCQRKFRKKPSIVITIDELQGQTGLVTRLESFVDILMLKKHKKIE